MNITLALIKPDAFERQLVGEIINRIEQARFRIVAARLLDPAEHRTGETPSGSGLGDARGWSPRAFYARQHEGKPYYEGLVAFMESGPSLALILALDDENAIARWRDLMGSWDLTVSRAGTIRADLMRQGDVSMRNLVHGSDSFESFDHELRLLEAEGLLP